MSVATRLDEARTPKGAEVARDGWLVEAEPADEIRDRHGSIEQGDEDLQSPVMAQGTHHRGAVSDSVLCIA